MAKVQAEEDQVELLSLEDETINQSPGRKEKEREATEFLRQQSLVKVDVSPDEIQAMSKMFAQPLDLCFKEVSISKLPAKFEVLKAKICKKEPPQPVKVLDWVSGRFPPASFTVLMGASGAGKTTLLNFISQRNVWLEGLECTGEITINGRSYNDMDYKQYTSYVMQDDVILETMTVREAFAFAGGLMFGKEAWRMHVERIPFILEIPHTLNSQIGSATSRGISGGERKRVAIGMEMLNNPTIIFADEPTTGLDSLASERIVRIFNTVTRLGRTVVATLHQPNTQTYERFQRLCLMANKKIVYNGPADESAAFFTGCGYPIPDRTNPVEHYLNMLTVTYKTDGDATYEDRMNKIHAGYDASEMKEAEPKVTEEPHVVKDIKTTFCLEFRMLAKRSLTNMLRNSMILKFALITSLAMTAMYMIAFWQVCVPEDEIGFNDRMGAIFFWMITINFVVSNATISSFPSERGMFFREQANKAYSPLAWYFAKVLAELPLWLLFTTFTTICIYFVAGLSIDDGSQFWIFLLISLLITWYSQAFAIFLGVVARTTEVGVEILPMLVTIQMLFCGFMINLDDIAEWLAPLEYISIFKYAFSAMVKNEMDTFDKDECNFGCDVDDLGFELGISENVWIVFALSIVWHLIAIGMTFKLASKIRA